MYETASKTEIILATRKDSRGNGVQIMATAASLQASLGIPVNVVVNSSMDLGVNPTTGARFNPITDYQVQLNYTTTTTTVTTTSTLTTTSSDFISPITKSSSGTP